MLDWLEVGGENGSEAGVPRAGIQAQRPAPAPHASQARHDRSMARNLSVAKPKLSGLGYSPRMSRIYVASDWRASGVFWFILARKYSGFLVDMDSLCLRHQIKITVLWIRYHSTFQHVIISTGISTILECRIDVMESLCLRHLIKITVLWIHDSFNIWKW